jgi:hypothetical protein
MVWAQQRSPRSVVWYVIRRITSETAGGLEPIGRSAVFGSSPTPATVGLAGEDRSPPALPLRPFRSSDAGPARRSQPRQGGSHTHGAGGGAKLRPSPGGAPSWEDSARRPEFSEALRVGCGTHRAGMALQRLRPGQGWVVETAEGARPPLVASLLPLAWGLARPRSPGPPGVGKAPAAAVRARPEGVRGRRVWSLPTATRHDTALPQPWASRRVERGRVMPRGRGAERRPSWASHWRFVLAARHGWRAVLRVLGPPSARSSCEAPRWSWGRTVALEGMRFPAPRFPCAQSATACTTLAATAASHDGPGRRDDLKEHSPCVRERTQMQRLPGRQPRVRMNLARAPRSCQARAPRAVRRRSPRRPSIRGAIGGHPAHPPA